MNGGSTVGGGTSDPNDNSLPRSPAKSEVTSDSELEPMTSASDDVGDPLRKKKKGIGEDDRNDINDEDTMNEIMTTFASETTLPGLPRVILARSRASRYFWLFICITCAISFTAGIVELLQRYFAYQKKVTVEMVSEPVPFPHVTLCNMRSFDFDILNQINDLFLLDKSAMTFVNQSTGNEFVDAYVKFVTKFAGLYYSKRATTDVRVQVALNEAISRMTLYNDIPSELIEEAGIQLDQYVATCSMGGATCNRTRDFVRFFNQYYFNCYTYTGLKSSSGSGADGEELQWLSPGLDSGLTMVVLAGSGMLEPNEYANLIPGIYDLGSPIAGADGVRVIIHPPDVVPFPLAEGFDVPAGFSTTFGVRPRRNVRIGPPHGDCVSTNPFDTEAHVSRPYRQLVCQKQCIQSYVKAECGCLDEMLLRPPSDYEESYDGSTMMCHSTELFPKTCATDPSPECFKALLDQHERVQCAKKTADRVKANRKIMAKCGCRAACDEQLYEVSYSLSLWPAAGYEGDSVYNELIENPDGALFVDRFEPWPRKKAAIWKFFNQSQPERLAAIRNFARINVYVADPEVIVTTESPDYELSQLVSDIGGQLGVWIGLSVITAAEVVELVVQLSHRFARRKSSRRRRRQLADTVLAVTADADAGEKC